MGLNCIIMKTNVIYLARNQPVYIKSKTRNRNFPQNHKPYINPEENLQWRHAKPSFLARQAN